MDVPLLYQITLNLISIYGYWKILDTSYNNYQKAKFLYENTLYLLNKAQRIISIIKSKGEYDKYKEQINEINEITDKIDYYVDSFNDIWEIIDLDELNNIEITDIGHFAQL